MKLRHIEIISDKGSYVLPFGDQYTYDDAEVIIENSKIYLTAAETPISFVNIVWENTFFTEEALLLGGSWERNYGELMWERLSQKKAMPWYFTAYEKGKLFGFGVETLPNALCSWKCSKEEITLSVDVRNGNSPLCLNGRKLELCKVITQEYEGDSFDSVCAFYKLLCPNPRLTREPIYGGNDWYCNYGDSSFEKILMHTKNIVSCVPEGAGKPYMVIDEGWEMYTLRPANSGPWIPNDKFGDMKKMADAILELGAIPGIWLRPLTTVEKVPDEHRLRTAGDEVTLDPSSPLVLDMVANDIKTIREWGYRLIKHDFSSWDVFGQWGKNLDMSVPMDFYDKTKTTAEIIKKFYETIRFAAGDDVIIIGCNTMTHLSAGLFEMQRTGDDTSGHEWERTKKMGINTLAFTMPQNGAFYTIDADCVGITDKIPWKTNRKWLDVLAKSGTPLFVSIDNDVFDDEVKNDIKEAFKKSAFNTVTSRPLDWMENQLPEKWQSIYGDDEYDWE